MAGKGDVFAELRESLSEDLKLQFEALASTRQSAAGGSTAASAALPQMAQNLKQTNDLFTSLNVLLRDTTKEQQKVVDGARRKGRDEQFLFDRFRAGTEAASNSVLRFGREIIGVPSLAGLLRRGLAGAGGDHGPLSTLQKSFQLVGIQLATHLIPTIAQVIAGLQRMAQAAAGSRSFVDATGKMLSAVSREGSILDTAGKTVSGIDYLYLGGKKKEEENIQLNEARIQGSILDRYARVRAGKRQWEMYQEAGGTKETLRQGGEADMPIWDKIFRDEKGRAAWREAQRADRQDMLREQAREGFKGGGLGGLLSRLSGVAGGPGFGQKAEDEGEAGAGGRRRGKGVKHDILPPGYHPQYSEVGDLREQMQTAAFSMTGLDLELMRAGNELSQKMLAELEKINARGDQRQFPAR